MKTRLEELPQSALMPLNIRNRFWDIAFYDVGSLTWDEQKFLFPPNGNVPNPVFSQYIYQEGEIIVVPPRRAGRKIRYFPTVEQFMDKEGQDIQGIVLAGVGSSVFGTAALARNVADTYNYDVAGIVTGYGGSDLIEEALGGWFVFGHLDRLANMIEGPSTAWSKKVAKGDVDTRSSADKRLENRISKTDDDVAALIDILRANPPKLELLLGHSKGSLLIDFALGQVIEESQGDEDLFERLKIVTLGAVVSLPKRFRERRGQSRQIIGALDWFGGMNSRLSLLHRAEIVPLAWHHLNPWFNFHLGVSKALSGNFAVTRS